MIKELAFLGHPDKQADLIADILVDIALANNPNARCAIEVMVKGQNNTLHVIVGGESSHIFTEEDIYNATKKAHILGTFGRVQVPKIQPLLLMTQQSPYIATNMGQGVGDQCIVVGFSASKNSAHSRATLYENAVFKTLLNTKSATGDGKMVVVKGDSKDRISVSVGGPLTDNDCDAFVDALNKVAIEDKNVDLPIVTINPPNRSGWLGGPLYDCGITGRKLACDAHGIYAPHGGGATSGKDMSKPDRRMKILADVLAEELLKKVNQIQSVDEICVGLAFEMGGTQPIGVELINKEKLPKETNTLLQQCVKNFDFSIVPQGKMVYRAHPWVEEILKSF